MNDSENRNDELKDAPMLKSIRRENPFRVPEEYFETLADKISERIIRQKPAGKVIPVRKNVWLKYAAAACIGAVLFSGIYYLSREKEKKEEFAMAAVSYDEIASSSYFFDLDENMLMEELAKSKADIPDSEFNAKAEDFLIENSADITNYYLNNL